MPTSGRRDTDLRRPPQMNPAAPNGAPTTKARSPEPPARCQRLGKSTDDLRVTLLVKNERDGLRALLGQLRHRLRCTVKADLLQGDRGGFGHALAPDVGAQLIKASCELHQPFSSLPALPSVVGPGAAGLFRGASD